MKKYLGHILLTLFACASFVFIHYTASRGILLFEDSLFADLASGLQTSLKAVEDDGKEILRRLEALAGDDVIIHSLAQFELGESLEKGALALRRLANSIAGCESLRLVGIDDRIVLDSASDALEGKPLRDDERQRMRSLLRKPGSFEFLEDGRAEVVVRCLSKAGNDVGVLRAVLAPAFLAGRLYSGAAKVLTVDGVVFIASEGLQLKREALAAMTAGVRRSMQAVHAADAVLVPARSGFSSQLFVGIAPRSGQGLPGIAGQILVLNGLLIVALVLLLVLRVLNHWEHGRLEAVRARIDSHDEAMQEMQATAEEIIRATDTMYLNEVVEYHPAAEPAVGLTQPADDEMPTLGSVLSRSRGESSDERTFETRDHDLELQSIIDQVAFRQEGDPGNGFDSGSALTVEDADSAQGTGEIDAWWTRMVSVLQRSLAVRDVLLLEEDGHGIFRVTRRSGFSAECETACTLSSGEKLYTLFAARNKVLFVRESALKTASMQRRFPGVSQEEIDQLAYVPVVQQGVVRAVLVFGRGGDAGAPLDQPALQEIQFLSII